MEIIIDEGEFAPESKPLRELHRECCEAILKKVALVVSDEVGSVLEALEGALEECLRGKKPGDDSDSDNES